MQNRAVPEHATPCCAATKLESSTTRCTRDGDCIKVKLPGVVRASIQNKLRCFSLSKTTWMPNGAVLRIVNDAAYGTENRGESWGSDK